MRLILAIAIMLTLAACSKSEDKNTTQPVIDLAPQRAQLQKAKDLEKQMQVDAENQRKVIEVQTK